MSDQFVRTRLLIGDGPLERLRNAKVAVFGVGGVGGYTVEALARSGVGTLHLYDDDTVSISNMNRQIAALWSTVGQPKAEVMAQRVRDIAPDCHVEVFRMFYLPQNADEVDLAQISLFDTVTDEDVLQELMEVEVNTLAPIDALNTLYRLQNKLKNRW